MRADCKHYETRTYRSGETVRKCNLDLAPDAPWRCPEHCLGFERRMADVNWDHGTLITPPTPPEPPGLDDGSAARLLDEAEDIVNAALPAAIAEVDGPGRRFPAPGDGDRPWWRRFGRRR
jgi:hypothetical protein